MAKSSKYNKLDEPLKKLESLSEQLLWKNYEHKDKFEYICEVQPDEENEKLIITDSKKENMKKSCVYIMVIEDRIFKIGTALRGMAGRIGSYNSGKVKFRTRGTNSGANYWVLQSMLNFKKKVTFYAYYPPVRKCKTVFGEIVDEPFPSSKTIEGVVLRQFEKKYGRKPIGCTQG